MASTIDVSKFNAQQLRELIQNANAALSAQRQGELNELRKEFEAKLKAAGLTVADAYPSASSAKSGKKSLPIKYRLEKNEWTGKGPTPRWLTDYESKGGKREELLV